MKVLTRVLAAAALVAASVIPVTMLAPSAGACTASTVVAIGGVGDPGSGWAPDADVRVQYSAQLGDIEGGVAAFDRAVADVRARCLGTHVIAAGFSQGAAIAHIWLQRSAHVPNKVGVLFSDPKQINSGSAFWMRDANFGGARTVSVCRHPDVICNLNSWNFGGYPHEHVAYDFRVRPMAGQSGIVWR
jgi:hypothetical protein